MQVLVELGRVTQSRRGCSTWIWPRRVKRLARTTHHTWDYRPLAGEEPNTAEILARPECGWITGQVETKALEFAVSHTVS